MAEGEDFDAPKLIVNDGDVFTVEKLVKHRYKKGKLEFYVKWVDYGSSHNTWEPESNILDERLTNNYWAAHPKAADAAAKKAASAPASAKAATPKAPKKAAVKQAPPAPSPPPPPEPTPMQKRRSGEPPCSSLKAVDAAARSRALPSVDSQASDTDYQEVAAFRKRLTPKKPVVSAAKRRSSARMTSDDDSPTPQKRVAIVPKEPPKRRTGMAPTAPPRAVPIDSVDEDDDDSPGPSTSSSYSIVPPAPTDSAHPHVIVRFKKPQARVAPMPKVVHPQSPSPPPFHPQEESNKKEEYPEENANTQAQQYEVETSGVRHEAEEKVPEEDPFEEEHFGDDQYEDILYGEEYDEQHAVDEDRRQKSTYPARFVDERGERYIAEDDIMDDDEEGLEGMHHHEDDNENERTAEKERPVPTSSELFVQGGQLLMHEGHLEDEDEDSDDDNGGGNYSICARVTIQPGQEEHFHRLIMQQYYKERNIDTDLCDEKKRLFFDHDEDIVDDTPVDDECSGDPSSKVITLKHARNILEILLSEVDRSVAKDDVNYVRAVLEEFVREYVPQNHVEEDMAKQFVEGIRETIRERERMAKKWKRSESVDSVRSSDEEVGEDYVDLEVDDEDADEDENTAWMYRRSEMESEDRTHVDFEQESEDVKLCYSDRVTRNQDISEHAQETVDNVAEQKPFESDMISADAELPSSSSHRELPRAEPLYVHAGEYEGQCVHACIHVDEDDEFYLGPNLIDEEDKQKSMKAVVLDHGNAPLAEMLISSAKNNRSLRKICNCEDLDDDHIVNRPMEECNTSEAQDINPLELLDTKPTETLGPSLSLLFSELALDEATDEENVVSAEEHPLEHFLSMAMEAHAEWRVPKLLAQLRRANAVAHCFNEKMIGWEEAKWMALMDEYSKELLDDMEERIAIREWIRKAHEAMGRGEHSPEQRLKERLTLVREQCAEEFEELIEACDVSIDDVLAQILDDDDVLLCAKSKEENDEQEVDSKPRALVQAGESFSAFAPFDVEVTDDVCEGEDVDDAKLVAYSAHPCIEDEKDAAAAKKKRQDRTCEAVCMEQEDLNAENGVGEEGVREDHASGANAVHSDIDLSSLSTTSSSSSSTCSSDGEDNEEADQRLSDESSTEESEWEAEEGEEGQMEEKEPSLLRKGSWESPASRDDEEHVEEGGEDDITDHHSGGVEANKEAKKVDSGGKKITSDSWSFDRVSEEASSSSSEDFEDKQVEEQPLSSDHSRCSTPEWMQGSMRDALPPSPPARAPRRLSSSPAVQGNEETLGDTIRAPHPEPVEVDEEPQVEEEEKDGTVPPSPADVKEQERRAEPLALLLFGDDDDHERAMVNIRMQAIVDEDEVMWGEIFEEEAEEARMAAFEAALHREEGDDGEEVTDDETSEDEKSENERNLINSIRNRLQ